MTPAQSVFDGITVTHILARDDYDGLVKLLDRTPERPLAFDLETVNRTGHNTHEWQAGSRIVALSLSFNGDSSIVMPVTHPAAPWYADDEAYDLLAYVAQAMRRHKLIAHNGKFDLRWLLAMTGVDLADRLLWDTMLASHVLDETSPNGLKPNAAPLAPGGARWDGLPMDDLENEEWTPLARYAGFDTAMTFRLYEHQRETLRQSGDASLARVFKWVAMPTSRVLTRVERRGMKVDLDRLHDAQERAQAEVDEATEWLDDFAGRVGVTPEGVGGKKSFEPTSKYLRALMKAGKEHDEIEALEQTPQGRDSWRKGVLRQLEDEYDLASALLAYRHGSKQLQFLNAWEAYADDHGRLHGTWRIHGTRTGRLSSADPNMQQVSRELKSIFTADEGYLFVEADYSQVELRLAAFIARCQPMMDVYADTSADLHTRMAAIAADVREQDVTKAQRQNAKAVNFGFIYGMQAPGFVSYSREVYGVEVSLAEARHLRRVFFDTWHGLEDWHAKYEWMAYENGYVTSPIGRRRLLPDAPNGDHSQLRQAINSPVQSFASDLMLLSMQAIDANLDHRDVRIVGTVHDSVLLEVREDAVDGLVQEVANYMLYPDVSKFGVTLDVPLAVEAVIGTHWSDADAIEQEFTQ